MNLDDRQHAPGPLIHRPRHSLMAAAALFSPSARAAGTVALERQGRERARRLVAVAKDAMRERRHPRNRRPGSLRSRTSWICRSVHGGWGNHPRAIPRRTTFGVTLQAAAALRIEPTSSACAVPRTDRTLPGGNQLAEQFLEITAIDLRVPPTAHIALGVCEVQPGRRDEARRY
jgi:hypothetical protein